MGKTKHVVEADSDSDLDTKINRLLSKRKQVEHSTFGPDFQRPKKRDVKEKKPAERGQPFVEFIDKKLMNRCAPINIVDVVKAMTIAQKTCVEEMGFGSMLRLQVTQTPTTLGYWLLMNYNNRLNELNIGSGVIKITPQKVHEVLGIPMGKIPVLGKSRPRLGEDVTIDLFKSQFPTSARISIKHVKDKLAADQGVGELFKINFLVLVNTCIGFVTKSTTFNQRFIAAIDKTSDIPNMDWCSYVIENLKTTKEEWRGINDQYNGPITFLVMFYTHEYQKKYGPFGTPVTTPAVNYIKTTTLNKMEKYLSNNGPPLEEDATEVAAAVTFSVDGKGIDAAAAAPAAVTISAAGKGLDETVDAAVADTTAVIVSAAGKRLDEATAAVTLTPDCQQLIA
ncbi:uncharacterized protein LOC143587858 [Bidens hawaiensis]|uniref:uncharacterized protein LOC143587858 n=1 Tax=Bidens hawaiensis TaxID=980011 RepID=UPI00404ABE00